MNEQLVVKNFGPITNATVDFKRVTVFIGPTGGGKSTLAKLAATIRDERLYTGELEGLLKQYGLKNFRNNFFAVEWLNTMSEMRFTFSESGLSVGAKSFTSIVDLVPFNIGDELNKQLGSLNDEVKDSPFFKVLMDEVMGKTLTLILKQTVKENFTSHQIAYIPAERAFIPALGYSWAGILRDDIGLPKILLEFANDFSLSRKEITELAIPIFNVKYIHIGGHDFIEVPGREEPLMLNETASGIQSVTPLLVLLEHLSRNTEQAQSFIIEEPELNLYPTAQQGLLNWLVEKCTQGENDLTITTHSPYLLAHFNLLLYAYQVAENHPERADDVAKVVPRASWINPREFAAYHVEGQQENGVRSIVNPETGLISYNGLDSTASAETAEFEKLMDINAGLEVE